MTTQVALESSWKFTLARRVRLLEPRLKPIFLRNLGTKWKNEIPKKYNQNSFFVVVVVVVVVVFLSLVRLGPGDRNFHILYQLCAGLSAEEKLDLKITNAESYHYLNQSEVFTIQGRSEADEFKITRSAMDTMGISSREQESIFRVVASILHLGNVV
jgi:hypothetical protein